jgi:aryl-alcohol dehydrogenase-like predicted oxidoreductase/Pyruvate/2-oxoacid:ferredoxin oxidoreductase delta subunit
MIKRELGNTGLMVPPIGFGVLTVGNTQLNYSVEEGADLLRYALERGVDFLDTAQYYETYPYIREALKSAAYDPVIASKCLSGSYEDMRFAVEEARREMDRDTVDIFLLHEVRSASDWEGRAGAWEYLHEAKAGGIVKAIGVSTHHVDVTEMCANIPDLDVVFPLINYKSLGIRNGNAAGTKESMAAAIKRCSEAGKGVFAMKVFGGGNLTGDYLTALDYVSSLPGIDSMTIGFGYRHEIDRIIEYAEGTIDRNYVPDVGHKKMRIDTGDCIGCGACIERCPNHAISRSLKGICEIEHSICLTCGYCAPVCPVRAIIMF